MRLPWLLFQDGRQKFYENGSKDSSKPVIQIHFKFSGFICHTIQCHGDLERTPQFAVNLTNKNINISFLTKMWYKSPSHCMHIGIIHFS